MSATTRRATGASSAVGLAPTAKSCSDTSRAARRRRSAQPRAAAAMHALEERRMLSFSSVIGASNTAAGISGAVDIFRGQLGALNANVVGSLASGRREINWDGVPAAQSAPNALPADFFNVNSPRGVVLSTPGTGFQVSSATTDAGPGQPAAARFGNINANYSTNFGVLSPQRLFTAVGSNITDVTFRVPGTDVPATVSGFGAVFTDIDDFSSTSLQFFDASGNLLTTLSGAQASGDASGEFFGASAANGERIARVRITSGSAALGPNDVSQGGTADVVAMDDFVFAEPQPLLASPQNFVVTNTNDTGFGSLRQAITAANTTAGADDITFAIPGTGVHTITPATPLPDITEAVNIDGYSQAGSAPNTGAFGEPINAHPTIELNGTSAGAAAAGLSFTSGASSVRGLVINRFGSIGGENILVKLAATGTTIAGNFVGTDPTGLTASGGSQVGIFAVSAAPVIGGTAPADRNLVAGSAITDIELSGTNSAVVQGNYVGTDATGTAVLSGLTDGIALINGINCAIGGTAPGAGNVVANHGGGIELDNGATLNRVQGNRIGTNAAATAVFGTLEGGITLFNTGTKNLIGGTSAGAGNIIAGAVDVGINIVNGSIGTVIQGNFIGTNTADAAGFGNGIGIVIFNSSLNLIGGNTPAEGNTIANSKFAGVDVAGFSTTVNNAVRNNRIFGSGGLPIDLNNDGLTFNDLNDVDTGPNNLQNFPVLAAATTNSTGTTVTGTLNSTPNTHFLIDLYAADAEGPGGPQAQVPVGTFIVTTDALGNADFSLALPNSVPGGSYITATATTTTSSPAGDTSEMAAPVHVVAVPPPTLSVNDVSVTEGNSGTKLLTFTITRSGDLGGASDVSYATANGTATAGSDYTAVPLTVLHFAPGQATRTVSVTVKGDTVVEADETFSLNLSSALGATISDGTGIGTIKNDDVAPVTQAVTSFTLINADTDTVIGTINEGDTLNLNLLPAHLAIRANTSPATVGSVRFGYDSVAGSFNADFHTENGAPNALFGDNGGDFVAGAVNLGSHTLTATPFTGANHTGSAGTAKTIHFKVVRVPVVTSFTLINADTDVAISTITNAQTLKLSLLPPHLAIRANVTGAAGSVKFGYDSVSGSFNSSFRTDNIGPFTLFGNTGNDYFAGAVNLGAHTLTATGYTGANATGSAGAALTIHFTVVA